MPSYNPITLYFVRRPEPGRTDTVPGRDDCLRLEKLGENNVRVIYTERSTDGPIIDITSMTYQRLIHNLLRLFWAVSNDEDPFHAVQTMIPGYPSFTMGVVAFKISVTTVIDMILTTCWQWPTISRMPAPPLREPMERFVEAPPPAYA